MTPQCSLIYIILIASMISAEPTCKPSKNNPRNVICSPGNDDYILEKGLVSDNNNTVRISLRRCRITEVNYKSFQGLPLLKYIDLSNNKLRKLKSGTLYEPEQLTHLNLSYNSITEFPLGIFDTDTKLQLLDLKGNKIENINPRILEPLPKLKHLDLSSNEILGSTLNPYIFDSSPQIEFMDFSRNDMRDADDDLLRALQAIEFLNLDRCMLTEVPAFATKPNLKTMKALFLSVNQISEINNPTTFANMDGLEILNLGWNVLKSLHEDVFKPIRNLKIIVLRNNKLTAIPDTLFKGMTSLSNIDLANNLITFVPVNAFRGTAVKNLNLASNQFTYLTDNFCLELKNSGVRLQKFYFNDNPWQCKCLRDILTEVEKYDIQYNSAKYDGAHAVCVYEDKYCHRHESFNQIYVDLYDKLITKS
ncbi:uncharacterized protein [Epargyreus clarus]|uniref:uncharacterized protein isoform X1 n=1 Tax=Epargyreus clarus TaxID=520877 RepID=UPI003C303CFE